MGTTVSVCASDKLLCALDRSDEAREDEANATQFSLNILDKAFSGHGDKTFDSLLSVITEEPTMSTTEDATVSEVKSVMYVAPASLHSSYGTVTNAAVNLLS